MPQQCIFDKGKSIRYSRPRMYNVWENRLLNSGKTIWLRWDFCRSRTSARFGKSARFQPEPKSGTALII